MENSRVSKQTVAFGWSIAVCAVLNSLIVIAKEKSSRVSGWMQKLTGHHWLTHVALVMIIFLVLGWLLGHSARAKEASTDVRRVTFQVVFGVTFGVLLVLGFYLVAD